MKYSYKIGIIKPARYWKGKKLPKEMKEKLTKRLRKLAKENILLGRLKGDNNPSKRLDVRRKISKALKGRNTYWMVGKRNPNWNGGSSFEPHDKSFDNKFKRAIRKRDNQICMVCGIHREKLKNRLSIHHINYNKLLSIPQNCISLCISCHTKTNGNRKHWTTLFQNLLTERYGYQYNNQEIVLEVKKSLS